jgi:hypothetical protein
LIPAQLCKAVKQSLHKRGRCLLPVQHSESNPLSHSSLFFSFLNLKYLFPFSDSQYLYLVMSNSDSAPPDESEDDGGWGITEEPEEVELITNGVAGSEG